MANNIKYCQLSDAELVFLLQKGDEAAFTQIYKSYWKTLRAFAYKRLENAEECENIVQDVFAELWACRHRSIEYLENYLYISVRNQISKHFAQKKKNPVLLQRFDEFEKSSEYADAPLIEKEITLNIESFLESLPKKRKQAYDMHSKEDMSTADISKKLGVSRKTVQNHIHTVNVALKLRFTQLMTLSLLITPFLAMVFRAYNNI